MMFPAGFARAEMPPIDWGGYVGLVYRATENEQGVGSSSWAPTLNLRALSYIYEPWFATWYADLSVASFLAYNERADTQSQVISGNAAIDLFPESLFPGQLFLQATDSRISSDEGSFELGDYRTFRYGYNQRYLTSDGSTSLFGEIEQIQEERLNTGETIDTQELELSGTHRSGSHAFDGNAIAQQTTRDPASVDNAFYSASFGHVYTPGPNVVVSSTLAANHNEAELLSLGAADSVEAMTSGLQATNRVDWQASERFRLSSNVLLDHQEIDSGFGSEQTRQLAEIDILGVYDLRSDLTASAGLGALFRRGDTEDDRTRQSLSLAYSPDSILFVTLPLAYSYGGAVGVTNATGSTEEGDEQVYFVNGSHGLNYSTTFGDNAWSMALDGTQSVDYEENTREGELTTVSHTVSATVSHVEPGGNSFGTVSFYDYRNFGRQDNELQQLTVTLNHTLGLDRYQTVSTTLSANAGRTTFDEQTTEYAFASARFNYFHQRLLGVGNLRFESELLGDYRVNRVDVELDPDLDFGLEDEFASTDDDNYRVRWRNRLDYSIGLLELEMRVDIEHGESGEAWAALFSITRSF